MSKQQKLAISSLSFIAANAMVWFSFLVGGGEMFTFDAGFASASGFVLGGVCFAACMDILE